MGFPAKNGKHVGYYDLDCALCEETMHLEVTGWVAVEPHPNGGNPRVFIDTFTDPTAMWLHLWTSHPEYAEGERRSE
jgi:hypothetical protein